MKQIRMIVRACVRMSQVLLLLCLMVIAWQASARLPEAGMLLEAAGGLRAKCLLFGATAFLALFFFLIYRMLGYLSKRGLFVVRLVCGCILLGGQLLFLLYYQSLYMWDSALVVGGVSTLIADGGIAPQALYYFGQYPNQNAFAVVTKLLLAIANLFGGTGMARLLVLNTCNLLCIDLAIVLTMKLAKVVFEELSDRAYTMLLVIIICQPFFYMGVSYYYTITLSMPFFMGFLYLACKAVRQEKETGPKLGGRMICAVLAGIVLSVGTLIRATCLVPAIAVFLCVGLNILHFGPDFKKTVVKMTVLLLSFLVSFMVVKPFLNRQIGLDTKDSAFPATHWVMMSMTPPGCHNAEDEAYTASFASAQEKRAAVRERMAQKAQQLGAKGFMNLALQKIRNTWSDGTNNYVLFMENCLHMDGMYPYVFGHHKDVAVLYHQAMLLLTILGSALSVICSFTRRSDIGAIYLFQLTFLGGILFYLLWETGAQYSLPFLFCMLFCGLDGWNGLASDVLRGKEKRYAQGGFVIVCAALLLVSTGSLFSLKDVLTKDAATYKSPVVNQIIANGELMGDAPIRQTFVTNDPFNQLIFQWRNTAGENSQAVYDVSLSDEEGTILMSGQIVAEGQPYQGAFIKEMDMVTPDGDTSYTLTLQKTDASADTISFVTYTCGTYAPYPKGTLTKGNQVQNGALMFQIARNEQKPYATARQYVFFMLVAVGIFLILEICCILEVKRKETT